MDNGYLEHIQHEVGRAGNELQAAYEVARLTTERTDESKAIAAALAAGKIVLIDEYPSYCRFTDAYLWLNRELVQVFDTLEDAAGVELFGGDDACRRLVYPNPPETVLPQTALDEIPF